MTRFQKPVCAFLMTVLAIFASSSSFAGEFCRVSNGGVYGACFPTLDSCQFGAEVTGGTCVYRESSGGMANDPSGLGALGALLGAIARDERIKKEQDAARQAELEQQRRTVEQARLAQLESDRRAAETKAREQAALDRLPEFGATCAELGFKRGSTPFSDCVIELYKRAKTR